jgi:hypothetical protein
MKIRGDEPFFGLKSLCKNVWNTWNWWRVIQNLTMNDIWRHIFWNYRHGMCFRMSCTCVFVSSILFWFPQRTHYFWRVFRFLFMERKQDYNVTSVKKMLKFAFKDVSTKNSEPIYWTILFVMLKIYFIYKEAGK